eukprot:222754-Chlamydomonas_euryale.AAC.1
MERLKMERLMREGSDESLGPSCETSRTVDCGCAACFAFCLREEKGRSSKRKIYAESVHSIIFLGKALFCVRGAVQTSSMHTTAFVRLVWRCRQGDCPEV